MLQMENTHEELKICRDSALNFASRMAVLVEWHLRMTNSPDNNNLTDPETIKLKIV